MMIAQENANEGPDKKHWFMGKDAFNIPAVHHQGIKQLWEKKWKFPVLIPSNLRQLSA